MFDSIHFSNGYWNAIFRRNLLCSRGKKRLYFCVGLAMWNGHLCRNVPKTINFRWNKCRLNPFQLASEFTQLIRHKSCAGGSQVNMSTWTNFKINVSVRIYAFIQLTVTAFSNAKGSHNGLDSAMIWRHLFQVAYTPNISKQKWKRTEVLTTSRH